MRCVLPEALSGVRNGVALMRSPLRFVTGLLDGPPVHPVRLGTSLLYVINTPELLQTVLVDRERSFVMGKLVTSARRIFGEGLGMNVMTAAGLRLHEPRLAQRRMIQPAFHRHHQDHYQRVIANVIAEVTGSWGSSVDLCRTGRQIGFRAAIRALLGGGTDEPAVADALERVLGGVVQDSLSPTWLRALPLPANRRRRTALSELDDYLRTRIGADSPLLQALRDDRHEKLTAQQIRDHLMTILGAGAETVSDTIPWIVHELHRAPALAAKVRDEVADVLGDRPLETVEIRSLDLCVRVVQETLRLHSPQWLLSRRTIEQVRLGTTVVPAGATIAYSLYTLHRDPRWHPEPTRFDPDRWLPERRALLPRCAFIPFSTGSGRCVGDGFAMTELVMVTAELVRHWKLTPPPGFTPREKVGLTVRPATMPVSCTPLTKEVRCQN